MALKQTMKMTLEYETSNKKAQYRLVQPQLGTRAFEDPEVFVTLYMTTNDQEKL